MLISENEHRVRDAGLGWRECSLQHFQILDSKRAPIVNVWTNKNLRNAKIKFQRCGTDDRARVGTIDDAIRAARGRQQHDCSAQVDLLIVRIGSITVELRRAECLQAITDIACALQRAEGSSPF